MRVYISAYEHVEVSQSEQLANQYRASNSKVCAQAASSLLYLRPYSKLFTSLYITNLLKYTIILLPHLNMQLNNRINRHKDTEMVISTRVFMFFLPVTPTF